MIVGARARFVLAAVLAAALYYWLLIYAVGYAFVIVPGREALASQSGWPYLWPQLAHTAGVLVAAIPIAALIRITCRSHPMAGALVAGSLAALGSVLATLLNEEVRAALTDTHLLMLVVDSVKFAIVLTLLTWLSLSLPFNNALERARNG